MKLFLFAALMSVALSATALLAASPTKEQTLSIIKPDAVAKHHIGEIIARFEMNGINIDAIKMVKLDQKLAEGFYGEHKGKPFFNDLVAFMTSGPIVVMVLSGDNIIAKNRELMGATDPSKAAPGTLRKDFAESMTKNAVHGSDSPASARREIEFFFSPEEIY
jgi:nucleoside-diphosphate kinase